MRKLVLLFAAGLLFALPSVVSADVITIQAPKTAPNQGSGGPNQFNLDHHDAYTWRIAGIDLTGRSITAATLTFHNISNWDSHANMLFVHLLDTARSFSSANGTHSATVNGSGGSGEEPAPGASHATKVNQFARPSSWGLQQRESHRNPCSMTNVGPWPAIL